MNVRRWRPVANLLLGGVLMLAVWVMLVWVASRPALKALIDLTPQQVNSVDPATVELLRDLRAEKAEIEFHLFYPQSDGEGADDFANQLARIRQRVTDVTRLLLRRYAYLGAESVTFVEHEPFRDTAAYRESAQAFGYTSADNEALVVAVRMPGKERRFRKLSLLSDLAVIDWPSQQQTPGPVPRSQVPVLKSYKGEAQITSALKSLLVQGTPIAYVLKGYAKNVQYDTTTPIGYGGLFASLMQSGFEVRELNLRDTARVPDDAAVVLVLEPRNDFPPRDADALFDYVKRGGRLFVNYVWSPVDGWNPTGGRLGELLGYELSERPVFHLIPDTTGQAGGRGLDGNEGVAGLGMSVNPQHPLTRRLAESGRRFELWWAPEIRERAGAPPGVRREPLLMTGNQGWLATLDANGQPDTRAPRVGLHPFMVGMACEVDARPGDDAGSHAASEAPRPGQVVLIGGVFCNNASMRYYGDFAVNVCNWMAERKVLLDIRGSTYEARFLSVQPPQLERIKTLLVWWIPGAFLLLGLSVWWRRRH